MQAIITSFVHSNYAVFLSVTFCVYGDEHLITLYEDSYCRRFFI